MAMSYKSFCWVLGTTSFRTDQLNRKIELQLRYLDQFWSDGKMASQSWSRNSRLQAAYYKFLKQNGFVEGSASRPAKDAREKTSGLVELGLVDDERRLTAPGKKILAISSAGDFGLDQNDILELSKDSHLYLLQLLKATKKTDYGTVRPFIVFANVMCQIKPDLLGDTYLTKEEFTYLLPLCVNKSRTKAVVDAVNHARTKGVETDVDQIIVSHLMEMENYKEALDYFKGAATVDEDVICMVGMNRKSGSDGKSRYDAEYVGVFTSLRDLVFKGVTEGRASRFVCALQKCNIKKYWIEHFFANGRGKRLGKNLVQKLRRNRSVFESKNELEYRTAFFKTWHLLKARATLKDYADLNRRYFALSDTVLFSNERVVFDLLPKVLFRKLFVWLDRESFNACGQLQDDIQLADVVRMQMPSKEALVSEATGKSPSYVRSNGGTRAVLKKERKSRFEKLLSGKFPREQVESLLVLMEDRHNDAKVQSAVTDNADVPTIFEYIVGIAWYYISGSTGDVLDYMNLSLGADFLPKTHAGGGEADIVWQYEENPPYYKKHALLIEVTLAEKDSQRRMEMEPVSRHLGEYRLAHPGDNISYCTFVTTNLNFNVIADFRGKRFQTYYNSSNKHEKVQGLKIIPIDTKMLRRMLEKKVSYASVCEIFDAYDRKTCDPVEWHDALRSAIEV